jgi:RimJ/RimL family protein N-acetyltransferase
MATHPGSREVDVVLRDGSIVQVCPATSADAPAMTLLLNRLSDRSRWLRFFSACPDLPRAARWATEVDNDRRCGLVATIDGHSQMVGHAGLERELGRPERAEVALEVADAMQGKGLGTTLLCQLAEAANLLGIQVLDAEVLPENHQMLRVFRDCGYPVKIHSLPGVQLVELGTSLAVTGLKPPGPHNTAADGILARPRIACRPRQAAGFSQGRNWRRSRKLILGCARRHARPPRTG